MASPAAILKLTESARDCEPLPDISINDVKPVSGSVPQIHKLKPASRSAEPPQDEKSATISIPVKIPTSASI
jgi:hypothetical protein